MSKVVFFLFIAINLLHAGEQATPQFSAEEIPQNHLKQHKNRLASETLAPHLTPRDPATARIVHNASTREERPTYHINAALKVSLAIAAFGVGFYAIWIAFTHPYHSGFHVHSLSRAFLALLKKEL